MRAVSYFSTEIENKTIKNITLHIWPKPDTQS